MDAPGGLLRWSPTFPEEVTRVSQLVDGVICTLTVRCNDDQCSNREKWNGSDTLYLRGCVRCGSPK
jgi:hypothetical protein